MKLSSLAVSIAVASMNGISNLPAQTIAPPPITPNIKTERAPSRSPRPVRPRQFQLCELTRDLKQTCTGFQIPGTSRDQVSVNTEPGGKITIQWTREVGRTRVSQTTTYVGQKPPGKPVYAGQVTWADGSTGTWKGAFRDELAIFDDAMITSKTPEVVSNVELDIRAMQKQREARTAAGYDPAKDPVTSLLVGSVAAAASKKAPAAQNFELDTSGFDKVKWGMTKAQVQRAYPKAHEFENYGMTVFGLEDFIVEGAVYLLVMDFSKSGLLYHISVVPNPTEPSPPEWTAEDMRDHLVARFNRVFGTPKIEYSATSTDYHWKSEGVFADVTFRPEVQDKEVRRPSTVPGRPDLYTLGRTQYKPANLNFHLAKY